MAKRNKTKQRQQRGLTVNRQRLRLSLHAPNKLVKPVPALALRVHATLKRLIPKHKPRTLTPNTIPHNKLRKLKRGVPKTLAHSKTLVQNLILTRLQKAPRSQPINTRR